MKKLISSLAVQLESLLERQLCWPQAVFWPLVVFGITSALGGCTQARLLSPLCDKNTSHIPNGLEGLYALSLPTEAGLIDNLPSVTELGVVIKKNTSGSVEIAVATIEDGWARLALPGSVGLPNTHVLCRIDSRSFLSSEAGMSMSAPASGYTVAEIVVGDDGIQILPIQADAKRAREAGFPMFFAPGFGFSRVIESGTSGALQVTSQVPSVVLVANHPGAPAATLGIMRRLSTSLYLRRLDEPSFMSRFRQKQFRLIASLAPVAQD